MYFKYIALWVMSRDACVLRCAARLCVLLFRHCAKSFNAQDERLATSPYLISRLHLPHAIVVRLHVRKINVIILIQLALAFYIKCVPPVGQLCVCRSRLRPCRCDEGSGILIGQMKRSGLIGQELMSLNEQT